eukprot:NODE_26768_length_538_cov_4.289538.p3 GENE.NODE_26768_length_538_cov_4.289538~~NODE_26768_length_538_cov_4.289538.p3  ORF type:complete len:85 (-),score=19.30 NODE_26768_length_538_cov_4.289538:113-367(-)
MDKAWSQYTHEMRRKARTWAPKPPRRLLPGPLSTALPRNNSGDAKSPSVASKGAAATISRAPEPSGRFWMQNMQKQAAHRVHHA